MKDLSPNICDAHTIPPKQQPCYPLLSVSELDILGLYGLQTAYPSSDHRF